jgi:hypothetical protein
MQQKQQPTTTIKRASLTEIDALHFGSVVERTCMHTHTNKDGYTALFFEIGCTAIESIYKDDEPAKNYILTYTECGFWAWFMVEYISHDEQLHNSQTPYRDYEKAKRLWIDTFKFYDSLNNFFKYKQPK